MTDRNYNESEKVDETVIYSGVDLDIFVVDCMKEDNNGMEMEEANNGSHCWVSHEQIDIPDLANTALE